MKELAKRFYRGMASVFGKKKIAGVVVKVDRGPRFITIWVRLRTHTDLDGAMKTNEAIALATGVKSVICRRQGGFLLYDFALPEKFWKSFSMQDTSGWQIGFSSGNRSVEFGFDKPNALFVGSPGSGKSVAMMAALFVACRNNSPEQLQIGICDPHSAIETFGVAHFLPIANEGIAIYQMIDYFYNEFQRRKRLGEMACQALPRLVLAIDEAHEVDCLGSKGFHNKDNLHRVMEICKGGRKFKCNVIISTQKPGEQDLPGIFGIVQYRFIGAVDSAKTSAHLGGRGGLDAHLLTYKGDMMHIDGSDVVRFQTAMPNEADWATLPKRKTTAVSNQTTANQEANQQLEPTILAAFLQNPEISPIEAQEKFGLPAIYHQKYQEFARALAKLKEQ